MAANRLTSHLVFMSLVCTTVILFGPLLYAGTKDSGGTNITDGELADFAKFKKEFGGKQVPIASRKFRIGSHKPVYEEIKPMIDRMIYLYPDSKDDLESAFDKPWIAIDRHFEPRRSGESKVIAQTKEAIFVDLQWITSIKEKNDQETLRKAFLHEAFRAWSMAVMKSVAHRAILSAGVIGFHNIENSFSSQYEDAITETLTPLFYNKMPMQMIFSSLNEILAEINTRIAELPARRSVDLHLASRYQALFRLKGVQVKKVIEIVCTGVSPSAGIRNEEAALNRSLTLIHKDIEKYFLRYSPADRDSFIETLNRKEYASLWLFLDGVYRWKPMPAGQNNMEQIDVRLFCENFKGFSPTLEALIKDAENNLPVIDPVLKDALEELPD